MMEMNAGNENFKSFYAHQIMLFISFAAKYGF